MSYIVEKIDLKDRRVLYELDVNARRSDAAIGKRVGLSKDVVNRRIKKLVKKGVIKHFFTMVDVTRLGYLSGRLFIKFQYDTPEKEVEMVNFLSPNRIPGGLDGLRDREICV